MLEKTEMKSENRYHRLYPLHRKEHCFACLCLYNGKQLDSWKNLFGEHIFSSVQLLSRIQLFVPHALQQARLPCPLPTPRTCSNSSPSNQWCHPTISSSVIPFSSCLQSFPASGSFPMSQFFTSHGQSFGIQLQHQSFQWIFRSCFLQDGLVGSPSSPKDSQESFPIP